MLGTHQVTAHGDNCTGRSPGAARWIHSCPNHLSACWDSHLAQSPPVFDRDPDVENDVPVVRHNREEEIILVWSGMTLVLLFILYQVWSA